MSIVVNQGGNWTQGSSYIGYDSLLLRTGAVVAASAEDVGFPGSAAASWLTSGGGWQVTGAGDKTLAVTLPSAENGNSYGIYKHNIGTLGLTVKLQYSSNGSTWTDVTDSEKTPSNDEVIFFVATAPVSAKYWRIHIAGLAASETLIIGQAFIGESFLVFSPPETGFTPPNLALNSRYITSRSDGGDFMGRSLIRRGNKTGFSVSLVERGWVRSVWLPFIKSAEKTPFYYGWDTLNFSTEVAFCYSDRNIEVPKYVSSAYMSIALNFFALLE